MLWEAHQSLKSDMLAEIDSRARARWQEGQMPAGSVIAFGALLDPEVLTLGFARRFTDYKRPDLILHDMERFRQLVTDPLQPVQIIFAGEAHPDDVAGKRLIQKIFQVAQDPEFAGRIAFVEDYDQELASYMVHGVDVWLNNPVPPQEASGTSGMKASLNGVPNLSILDGWWIEGYSGENGWAFGAQETQDREERRAPDAAAIYRLLEDEIIPRYYERSDDGSPHQFILVMKESIKTVAPQFGTRRMVKAYVRRFYNEAIKAEKT
jgi:starch phosphorylase